MRIKILRRLVKLHSLVLLDVEVICCLLQLYHVQANKIINSQLNNSFMSEGSEWYEA